jgi:predicted dehydrogenase
MRPLHTDRRWFLLGSTALVLGQAGALAGEDGDDEPVRVAVVGTGARGCDLIRALSTIDGADIVAVCDDYAPHLERGQSYAGPEARAFRDFDAMLGEMKPRAVVVATPLDRHFAMCREAIDAGCDVFCEKTMCYSVEQAREIAGLAAARKAVFQVGLQRRANAIYQQAEAMVEAGMLGRIAAIKCQWHRNNNWRRPVPVPRGDARWGALERRLNWRLYGESSQGLMSELAAHQLDVANRLIGRPPLRAIGSGGIDYWRDGREVFDNVFCIYEYQADPPPGEAGGRSTVRVTYSSIQNNAFEGASELIMGTRGTLLLTQAKGLFYREMGVDDPGWSREGRAGGDASIITSGKTLKMASDPWAHRGKPFEIEATGDDTRAELVAFLDHVRRRDPATICDARDGLINTATVLIGNRAMREGQPVAFPEGLA